MTFKTDLSTIMINNESSRKNQNQPILTSIRFVGIDQGYFGELYPDPHQPR